jgi:TDG/mug DNA glycosylase family protein
MPDLLRPGLRLVVCGAVAGHASAARSGNRLWRVLHEVGLTSSVLQPGDYTLLLENGIGLTALAKYSADMDDALPGNALLLPTRAREWVIKMVNSPPSPNC